MRLKAKPVLLAGLALALAAGALGYLGYISSTREVPARGGRVLEGLVVDGPLSLLPPFAGDTQNSRDLSSLLYRGLTRTGPDARPVAELASGWEISPDAKIYTFHLRTGLRWSDGKPLTSADAVYTLGLLQGPALAQTPTGQAWAGCSVAAPDPLTVVYTLKSPSAPFLALTSLGLVPEHALQARAVESLREATDVPTSGPFRVRGVDGQHLYLDRNPLAYQPPLLDGLDFQLFGSEEAAIQALVDGKVDLVAGLQPRDAQRLTRVRNRRVARAGSFAYTQLLLNQKQPLLSDANVRTAIADAIDRRGIITHVLGGWGSALDSPVPPSIRWASPNSQPAAKDQAAAMAALDKAGWVRGRSRFREKDGKPLVMKLAAADLEPYRSVAQGIQRDLSRVGMQADVSYYPQVRLVGEILDSRAFDSILTAVDNGPDPDFYVFWHSSQSNPGGFNFSGMPKNGFLDDDLERGRFQSDPKARREAYVDAARILREDHAAVFLFSPDVLLGINQRLRGVRLNPGIETADRFDSVDQWYVQTSRVGR